MAVKFYLRNNSNYSIERIHESHCLIQFAFEDFHTVESQPIKISNQSNNSSTAVFINIFLFLIYDQEVE